jgi:multiple sugar transport system permease protein
MSAWQGFPFQMVVYLAGLQSINHDLYEAARLDGANRWNEFRHITMPGLLNTHILVVMTTTILAFKLFTQVELLTKGGPSGVTDTLVRFIYLTGFRQGKVGIAAAAAVIFFLIVLAISLVQRRLVKEERAVE